MIFTFVENDKIGFYIHIGKFIKIPNILVLLITNLFV
jgi:hypothetical protein